MTIKLHIPGLPNTITRSEFTHDSTTSFILDFIQMMSTRNVEIYYYGVETSKIDMSSGNIKIIDILSKKEWDNLCIESAIYLYPNISVDEAMKKLENPKFYTDELSIDDTPLSIEFNKKLRLNLEHKYKSVVSDLVCVSHSTIYNKALEGLNFTVIEIGIRYENSSKSFRVFDTNLLLSNTLALEKRPPHNYWFVVPTPFNIMNWRLNLNPFSDRVGFLGKINNNKGCNIIVEIANRFPTIQFYICGFGNPDKYLVSPNIVYKPPVYDKERSEYLGSCAAILLPFTVYKDFSRVAVEAQLCGTPLICSDFGCLTEIVEQFNTGLRCHTLADYCYGIKMVLDGKFNRQYIRDKTAEKYDMYKIAYQYEYVFNSIINIFTPNKRGWYSTDSYMESLECYYRKNKPKIYLFLPYFGKFPNYFQLYLDSLAVNNGILCVFIITDIDISCYTLPSNAIYVYMTLDTLRTRFACMLEEVYGKIVSPSELVKNVYKLVDFKISYPIIFNDLIETHHLTDNDFVGWGDCDLIYGNLHNFINFNENFHIIGGFHGHFTAIRNNNSFKNLFKTTPRYFELCTDNNNTYITDEIAYRKPLMDYLYTNKLKMFYINRWMCDIIPPVFYHKFRPDHGNLDKNFFNSNDHSKNINYVCFDNKNRQLITTYEDGQSFESTYCHLQKRKMKLEFVQYEDKFYIKEHEFTVVVD